MLVVDAFTNATAMMTSNVSSSSYLCGLRTYASGPFTSRPELPIRLGFTKIKGKYQDLILHEIPAPIIEHDISAFFKHELAKVREG